MPPATGYGLCPEVSRQREYRQHRRGSPGDGALVDALALSGLACAAGKRDAVDHHRFTAHILTCEFGLAAHADVDRFEIQASRRRRGGLIRRMRRG